LHYVIRDRPDEAEQTLERLLEQGRQAITEGRNAVQGLRSSTLAANDLASAIIAFGEGLSADQGSPNCPELRVQVEGKSQDLPPLVRDEVYWIAREMLLNAFRHARAKRIEVEILYNPQQFRLRVTDNGKGIDAQVLNVGGSAGHHGLPGNAGTRRNCGGQADRVEQTRFRHRDRADDSRLYRLQEIPCHAPKLIDVVRDAFCLDIKKCMLRRFPSRRILEGLELVCENVYGLLVEQAPGHDEEEEYAQRWNCWR
jgi:hypothetical protein